MQTQTTKHKSNGHARADGHKPEVTSLEKIRATSTYGKLVRVAGGSFTRLERQDLEGDMAGDGPAAFIGEPQCAFVPQEVHLFGSSDQTVSLTSVLVSGQVTPLALLARPRLERALRSYSIGGATTVGMGDPLVVQCSTLLAKKRHSVVVKGKSALAHDVFGSSVMSTSRCAIPSKPRRYFEAEGKKKDALQHGGFRNCQTRVPFACCLAAVEIQTNAEPGELVVYNVVAGSQSLTLDATPLPVEAFMQPGGLPLESVPMAPMQSVSVSVARSERLGTKHAWFEVTLYLLPVGAR